MITCIDKLKTTLHDLIHEMSDHYWLYVSDPKRNFSRDRKLSFEKVLEILVSMGGGSLRNELIDYFHCSADTASTSAFVQRRAQLLPEAMEYLFHQFTEVTAKATEEFCVHRSSVPPSQQAFSQNRYRVVLLATSLGDNIVGMDNCIMFDD